MIQKIVNKLKFGNSPSTIFIFQDSQAREQLKNYLPLSGGMVSGLISAQSFLINGIQPNISGGLVKLNLDGKIPENLYEKGLTGFVESDPIYTADKPSIALKSQIPSAVSQLENDVPYLSSTCAAIPANIIESSIKTQELCDNLMDQLHPKAGSMYMGTVHLQDVPLDLERVDWPTTRKQCQLLIKVLGTNIYQLELTSTGYGQRSWISMYNGNNWQESRMQYGDARCPWFTKLLAPLSGYNQSTAHERVLYKQCRGATEKYVDDLFNSIGGDYLSAYNPTGSGTLTIDKIYISGQVGTVPSSIGYLIQTASGIYLGSEQEQIDTHSQMYQINFGAMNAVSGFLAYAHGRKNQALGRYSVADGYKNTVLGQVSRAEGTSTFAGPGSNIHVEGSYTSAYLNNDHAEGKNNLISSQFGHVEGLSNKVYGIASHGEGYNNNLNGRYSHIQGNSNIIIGNESHAQGTYNSITGDINHAQGLSTIISNSIGSHAEGQLTYINGNYSHAEGSSTSALAYYSHVQGAKTIAKGIYSHSQGNQSKTYGDYSHAEGQMCEASGNVSHAEGNYGKAYGRGSHAEGNHTTANNEYSHAEGYYTTANSNYGHAEGSQTQANGQASHSEGVGTRTYANEIAQHVEGKWNKILSGYQKIVGGGTSNGDRKNIYTLDWNGNAEFNGSVTTSGIIIKGFEDNSLLVYKNGKISALGKPTAPSLLVFDGTNYSWVPYSSYDE